MSIKERLKKNGTRNLIILGIVLFSIVYISPSMFVVVGPGQVGVLFKSLSGGTITDRVYGEGLHVLAPWNVMYRYDARLATIKEKIPGLTKNGLSISTTVSLRYRLEKDRIPFLHQNIGPEFIKVLLRPVLNSAVREELGELTPEQVYTSCSVQIQEKIVEECRRELKDFPILVDQAILEYLELPETVNEAIENKLRLEQAFLEYEFRLKKEEEEIARQLLIAEGLKKFQETVPQELSPVVRQWLGFQATMELAKSQNAKVLVLNGGEMRIPLVLDPDNLMPPTPAPKTDLLPAVPQPPEQAPAPEAEPEEIAKIGALWEKAWKEIKGDDAAQ